MLEEGEEEDTELVTTDNLDYTATGPDHSLVVKTGCNLVAEAGMEPGCNLPVEAGCNSLGVGGCKLLMEAGLPVAGCNLTVETGCNSLGVGGCKLLTEPGCTLPVDSGRNLPLVLVGWSTRTVGEVLVESRQS